MRSRYLQYKKEALELRKAGYSLRDVKKKLGVPSSTLSGWFKDVELTLNQKQKLHENWLHALDAARKEAVKWHNAQKKLRLDQAKNQALFTLSKLDHTNTQIMELALSLLYLGEGSKTDTTSLGNSNPAVLKFFIKCIISLYGRDIKKIKGELHLRADQDIEELKAYWSKELQIPVENFRANIDKRTVGSLTYSHYKGVCNIVVGNIAIQRRLSYLANEYFKKLAIY